MSERAEELVDDELPELRRAQWPTFTLEELANQLTINLEQAREKLELWVKRSIVSKIGEVEISEDGTKSTLFGVTDLRVAIEMLASGGVALEDALADYMLECPVCLAIYTTDRQMIHCSRCGSFHESQSRKLLGIVL